MKKQIKRTTLDELIQKFSQDEEFVIGYKKRRLYLEIAHLIHDLREKVGLSQAEVARRAKVSQPMIARLENGDPRRTPTLETINRILAALGYQLVLEVKPLNAA